MTPTLLVGCVGAAVLVAYVVWFVREQNVSRLGVRQRLACLFGGHCWTYLMTPGDCSSAAGKIGGLPGPVAVQTFVNCSGRCASCGKSQKLTFVVESVPS